MTSTHTATTSGATMCTAARFLAVLLLGVLPLLGGLTAEAAAATVAGTRDDPAAGPGRMVLVLDSSGSMKEPAGGGGSKIEAARTALDRVVADLPEDAEVGLRVFGATVFSRDQKGACTDSQLVVRPGTGNRADLRRAVASYKPYGETPIGYALNRAAGDLGSEGQRSIVLVSDGIATCQPDPCDVARRLADQGIDLQIDVVGLGVSGKARNQLRCIAAQGNGTYYDADSADEITKSLSKASDRAVRPFRLEGTPITGGAGSDQATPVTAGEWTDTVKQSGGERWYRYDRRHRGSSVLFSTALLNRYGAQSIELDITTEDGDSCDGDATGSPYSETAFFGVGAIAGPTEGDYGVDAPCLTKPLLIKVSRSSGGDDFETPFTMKIAEEPRVTNADALPDGAYGMDTAYVEPAASGSARPVTGGSSFGDAVEITGGVYRGTIVPGETQVFKVHLGWGQRLATKVLTPAMTPALADIGAGSDSATLQVLNPMRVTESSLTTGVTNTGQLGSAQPSSIGAGTIPVRWRNRYTSSATYLDGDYYLVYSADKDKEGRSAEFPFTLRVEVQGQETGAPTYADDGTVDTGATATPDEKETSGTAGKSTASAPSGDGTGLSTPVRLAAAGGLGLVALACVAGAVLFLRRTTG
jgi:Ca-activated chloride channel family protein